MTECTSTIEAAIRAQQKNDNEEEQGGYISLHDAIRTLEAAGLEPKDLSRTEPKSEENSVGFMAGAKMNYSGNFRYERPPYGRRYNRFRNNRYRQTDINTSDHHPSGVGKTTTTI